ncbi:hypothetical protein DUI87_08083 [Hirundo rustica rustica]|uniref:Uncharacterized protein n=1 Tax=Hirundo rustica rustica TaxID=333673 RepID=A0A3M0KRJ3_HIRRU|nr:hypothetical protein DUI87_08083 [Hirundo rustica rustica]
MVRQLSRCRLWSSKEEQEIHLQPMEDSTLEFHWWMFKGGCGPVESPRWTRLMAGPVGQWGEEPMFADRICDPEGDPQ